MKHHLPKNIKIREKGIKVDIRFDRLNKQFDNAQSALTKTVFQDMKPYMPNPNLAQMVDDSTIIAAKGPQGRFLYEGRKMVAANTGSAYAKRGEKKVLVCEKFKPSGKYGQDERLHYTNPQAKPRWFEVAKNEHLKDWVKKVKKIAGGK